MQNIIDLNKVKDEVKDIFGNIQMIMNYVTLWIKIIRLIVVYKFV